MKITLQIVYSLQLASWIEKTADDDVAEHAIPDGIIADTVIESAEDEFWADDLHLRIVQGTDEAIYHILLFINVRQRGTFLLLYEGRGLLHQFLHC